MVDLDARAFAILGLPRNASDRDVRRRYRLLATRWHPDRFAKDPAGQAEASIQMRLINDAVRRIVARGGGDAQAGPSGRPEGAEPGGRLSREQIENIVANLGTDGPVDWMLGLVSPWHQTVSRARMSYVLAWGTAVIADLIGRWWTIGRETNLSPWIFSAVFVCAFVVFLRILPTEGRDADES